MSEQRTRAEVLAGLRAEAKSRLNCGHPLCGKGAHPHTVAAANAPKAANTPKAASVKYARLRINRGQPWDEMACAACGKLKSKSEFYASSGRVCKKCFNKRASATQRKP